MSSFPASWSFPERRAFEGQFVTLTPLRAETDGASLFLATHQSPEFAPMWRYLPYGPFADENAMREFLQTCETSSDKLFFAVHSHELNRTIGALAIINIMPENGCAEIGHVWYSPLVQRTKVNTESVFLLLQHLFDDLGYRRAEWKCNNRNEASKKAARRLGFTYEGLFRQHMVVKGESRDTAWFSMLDTEWPQRKANLQKWLYVDDSVSLSQLNAS